MSRTGSAALNCIATAGDPRLLDRLREQHITLEVCPFSNLATGVVPALAAHPLPGLLTAGVPVILVFGLADARGQPSRAAYAGGGCPGRVRLAGTAAGTDWDQSYLRSRRLPSRSGCGHRTCCPSLSAPRSAPTGAPAAWLGRAAGSSPPRTTRTSRLHRCSCDRSLVLARRRPAGCWRRPPPRRIPRRTSAPAARFAFG